MSTATPAAFMGGYGRRIWPSLSSICAMGKEVVFLERFHHKEANFSSSQAAEIGHVCIREGFEICTAAGET